MDSFCPYKESHREYTEKINPSALCENTLRPLREPGLKAFLAKPAKKEQHKERKERKTIEQ